jgi:glycosyltransferase involved in cell wall biosynthesis
MIEKTPKISVIITVFNGDAFLNDTLESLFKQDDDDFEIVVINDGSTDKTSDILCDWVDRESQLRVFNKEHLGRIGALNEGIKQARGRYIAISDADDLSRVDRLRIQAHYLDTHPSVGMVGSYAKVIDDKGLLTGDEIIAPENHVDIVRILLRYNPFVHSSVMYRRDILGGTGGYTSRFIPGFEWEMYAKIIEQAEVATIPEFLVLYRRYPTSLTFRRSWLRRLYGVTRARWFVFRRLKYSWKHVPEVFIGLADLFPKRI